MSKLIALVERHKRFLMFCLVGGSGVLVNLGVFAAVLWSWPGADDLKTAGAGSLPTNVAGVVGWVVSVVSNFALNDRFTFQDQVAPAREGWPRRLARYYVSATVTLVLQLAVLNALLLALTSGPLALSVAAWAKQPTVSGAFFGLVLTYVRSFCNLCGIALGTVVNYVLSKRWVFR